MTKIADWVYVASRNWGKVQNNFLTVVYFFEFFKGIVRYFLLMREIAVTIRHCAKVMKNVFRGVGAVEWTADSNIKTHN